MGQEEEGGGKGGSTATISRRVLEAYTRDVVHAIARLDHDSMHELGVAPGDIVQIKGQHRSTVAKCFPLYPSDEGKGIVRISLLVRANVGVQIGDNVSVSKTLSAPAQKVVVVSQEAIPPLDECYLNDALEGNPVALNDTVVVPYFGGNLSFRVVRTVPRGVAVTITRTTAFLISDNRKRIWLASANTLDRNLKWTGR